MTAPRVICWVPGSGLVGPPGVLAIQANQPGAPIMGRVLVDVIQAAYRVLPKRMASREAIAVLLAIGYQESRLSRRRQAGGPARGFWQFEAVGTRGVLMHPSTARAATRAAAELQYRTTDPAVLTAAMEHNDVLAAAFARLLLWTLPQALPGREHVEDGWRQYLLAWRPGRPGPERWATSWMIGWSLVDGAI